MKISIFKLVTAFFSVSLFVFTSLFGFAEDKFAFPDAKYEVRVERSIMVPMRDGVRLSTDLYFPEGAGEKFPVILIRLPYNKERFFARQWGNAAYDFAGQGYVVAVQDMRGRFESEGEFIVQYETEAEVEMRHDILVYTSDVLKEGVEVTGPIKAVLYVSSSEKDTDFTAKLVDVYPDGTAYNIQEGILRARYREGFIQRVWMKPGEVYQLEIDLQTTSNFFGQGHRIRVEISSSNFPRFERNLNTGGNNYDEIEWIVAKNTIHHSKKHSSHIILPIIED